MAVFKTCVGEILVLVVAIFGCFLNSDWDLDLLFILKKLEYFPCTVGRMVVRWICVGCRQKWLWSLKMVVR